MLSNVISSTAIFASSDIGATLAYYKDVLGFESSWTWGEPPNFGSASMGGVTIMFSLQPEVVKKVRGHEHWVKVEDPDELYRLHTSKGAKLAANIADKPWGAREYVIEDINGYHLRFAGPPADGAPPSEPFPEGVTLERRKPTVEEFAGVASKTFGNHEPVPGVLERTWDGVVASSPDREVIGMLRIMWDAPAWFSIWDVTVVPDWQGKRIGSAMMKEALEMIRAASPGATVHLFTYKHGFYERLGFAKETVSLRRV